MDKKTARFLVLEGLIVLVVLLLGQYYGYPIAGKDALEERALKSTELHNARIVDKADLKTSVVFILEVDGQYCEKMFEQSLVFTRYREKPLVLLRKVTDDKGYEFFAQDARHNILYMVNEQGQFRLLKLGETDGFKVAIAIGGGTLLLLGAIFGVGRIKEKPKVFNHRKLKR